MAILAKTNGWLIAGKIVDESEIAKYFQSLDSKHIQQIMNDDETQKLFENLDDALDWQDDKNNTDSSYLKKRINHENNTITMLQAALHTNYTHDFSAL